jgi:hypothetical protein
MLCAKKDEISLEFDQAMAFSDALMSQFCLDGKEDQIASGSAEGNAVKLKLASPSDARTSTDLRDRKWDSRESALRAERHRRADVLRGENRTRR